MDPNQLIVGTVALAGAAIKTVVSGIKQLVPGLAPNVLRIMSLVLGTLSGPLLRVELVPLPNASPLMLLGNHLLGGVIVGFIAMGQHESVDMVKPAKK